MGWDYEDSIEKKTKWMSPFHLPILATAIFIFWCSAEGNEKGMLSPKLEDHGEKETQKPSCDFKVVVSEPDFCVIHGMVRDIDVTLVPILGTCNGSATLSVSGLPSGTTKTILPSPKIRFKKGTAVATVRIDTAGIVLKEGLTTSSLSFMVIAVRLK